MKYSHSGNFKKKEQQCIVCSLEEASRAMKKEKSCRGHPPSVPKPIQHLNSSLDLRVDHIVSKIWRNKIRQQKQAELMNNSRFSLKLIYTFW